MLMRDGHFDYGNGFHGRVYLNPHQLFRHPSTIWRLAQDLLDVLPADLVSRTEVVAGPATGGALLAHTIAGLLDGRRALTHPPCSFAPFTPGEGKFTAAQLLRPPDGGQARAARRRRAEHRQDVRALRRAGPGGRRRPCIATVEICDRMEAIVDLGVPNYRAGRVSGARELPRGRVPDVRGGRAGDVVLIANWRRAGVVDAGGARR